jgi:CRISPR/Cas system-associated protein Csm6
MNWKHCAEMHREFFQEQAEHLRANQEKHKTDHEKSMETFYEGMANMAELAVKQYTFMIEQYKNKSYVPEETN